MRRLGASVCVVALFSVLVVPRALPRPVSRSSAALSTRDSALVVAMNAARTARGLPRLRIDVRLTRAARFHSLDMLRRHYFAHGDFGARSQEDDRNAARGLVGEQLLGDLPAVPAGHHHVEQDDVRLLGARDLQPGVAVGSLEDLHPLGLQVDPAEEANRRLVVDNEYGRHRDSCLLSAGLRATGSSKAKLEPAPSLESTHMRPPIAETRPWAMKRPRPVPLAEGSRVMASPR